MRQPDSEEEAGSESRSSATLKAETAEPVTTEPAFAPPSLPDTETIADPPSELLEAALLYAEHGWRVFPLHSVGPDGECTCRNPGCRWPESRRAGKHPRTRHGVKAATTDLSKVRQWWTGWPDANIGFAPPRSILILDVDGQEGRQSVKGKHLPPTVCARTGRGWHYYFRLPDGLTVLNDTALLPGLDVKTAGGYVVVPPSRHASGTLYDWAHGLSPEEVGLASCPDWLIGLVKTETRKHSSSQDNARAGDSPAGTVGRKVPQSGDTSDANIPEGQRNSELASLGGRLREHGFRLPEITDALQAANKNRCRPPLPEDEVHCIARSVAGYPAGPVRIDCRIVNANLKDGPIYAAMLLAAGIVEDAITDTAGVCQSTVDRWLREMRAYRKQDIEAVARTRPSQRYVAIPRGILFDKGLKTPEKVTALVLGSYFRNGVAQVSRETLVQRRGLSAGTVSDHIAALKKRGFLKVSAGRFDPDLGRRERPNRYKWRETE